MGFGQSFSSSRAQKEPFSAVFHQVWLLARFPGLTTIRSFNSRNLKKHSKMYAIIADGGRQYKVEEGQILEIDFREVEAGSELKFERVLAVGGDSGLKLGTPTLAGASVTAKVIEETKGEKLVVQKFRRRKNSKRRNGHRQKFVKVKIGSIAG